ncbi:hypothetical protein IFM89_024861 [Coptis chinensis]|uniref:Pre-nudix hydrolase domain-containing protein n=1 Tax=Coptis chinensis TaxID=261450 RepID=A0A835LST2_9MAGN|nr:hypothetical protein IFM89_024861 [Coptis chinensis]
MVTILTINMTMSTVNEGSLFPGPYSVRWSSYPIPYSTRTLNLSVPKRGVLGKQLLSAISVGRQNSSFNNSKSLFQDRQLCKGGKALVVSPNISSPHTKLELLDAYDDEYEGVIIDPVCLPSSANAFASLLQASLFEWRLKGKKGVWLRILTEQADLVPIAIKEGFSYHHAEPGYVMLTYWIPDEPCLLPDSPSHHIGVGAFVINENREVLVVKEKQCPCHCAGLWKLPTGYINKIDTAFLEVIAFRHAHRMAFEKSDLLFLCMLKPSSSDIKIDEKEIQAAKWMPLKEFVTQPFFQEDHMLKRVIDISVATYENHYHGFHANQLISKLDGQLSRLYYNDWIKF